MKVKEEETARKRKPSLYACVLILIRKLSEVWVEGQLRPDEAAALSCLRKSSGGGGGNSPRATRQVATGDI